MVNWQGNQMVKEYFSKVGLLSDRDLDWIVNIGMKKTIAKDDILIYQGVPINELYILLEGTLAVFVSFSAQVKQATEKRIATINSGEIVGELSFIDTLPPQATVKAIEQSTLISLPWQELEIKIEQDVGFAARFYQTISALLSYRLRNISALLVQSNLISAPPLRKVLFVFSVLNDSDIDWMIENGKRVNSSAGKVLIKQGEPVEAFYILLDGKLAVSITVGEGENKVNQEINQLSNGEIVGEISFVETGKASATIECCKHSVLLSIPQQKLAAKLKQDMGFASRFYRAIAIILSDRIRDSLIRRGYGYISFMKGDYLDEEIESEDELDMNTLQQTALAATKFDWMIKRVNSNY